jgi:hypothetical protein
LLQRLYQLHQAAPKATFTTPLITTPPGEVIDNRFTAFTLSASLNTEGIGLSFCSESKNQPRLQAELKKFKGVSIAHAFIYARMTH